MAAKIKVIDKRICRASQDVDYVEVLTLSCSLQDHKLRITIRSNAYANQSYAKVERWNGDEWKYLHSLGGGNMKTPTALYVHHPSVDGDLEGKFRKDRDELVKLAGDILS